MTTDLLALQSRLRRCTRCLQAGYPIQGPPIFSGVAGARVMLVGQAPSQVDAGNDLLPFSGPAGARLFRWLAQAGWQEETFRRIAYLTSVTKCYPGPSPSGRGDRPPTQAEQGLCEEWLDAEIALVDPALVIPVGALAIKRFFGAGRRLADVIGLRFQLQGRVVIPLPHPSGASAWTQSPAHQQLIGRAIALLAEVRQEMEG